MGILDIITRWYDDIVHCISRWYNTYVTGHRKSYKISPEEHYAITNFDVLYNELRLNRELMDAVHNSIRQKSQKLRIKSQ